MAKFYDPLKGPPPPGTKVIRFNKDGSISADTESRKMPAEAASAKMLAVADLIASGQLSAEEGVDRTVRLAREIRAAAIREAADQLSVDLAIKFAFFGESETTETMRVVLEDLDIIAEGAEKGTL